MNRTVTAPSLRAELRARATATHIPQRISPKFLTGKIRASLPRAAGRFFALPVCMRHSVHYDRDRTEGLTNIDIVESLSATYGVPRVFAARV